MRWSEADNERLSILWAQGLSAKKIGIAMGGRYSKNAIIGSAHRLGLPPRRVPLAPGEVRPQPPRRSRSRSKCEVIEAITREVMQAAPPPNKPAAKRKHSFIPLSPSADTVVTRRAVNNGVGLSMRDIKWADPDRAESALDPDAVPIEQRKSFLELQEQHCRFPYGMPGEVGFFFCGGERADSCYPYCPMHCRLAYRGSGTKSVYAFGRRG